MPDYEPVPVEAATGIALDYAKDIVVILSVDRAFGMTHVTTYGMQPHDKIIAAKIGEEIGGDYCLIDERTIFEDFRDVLAAEAAATIQRLTRANEQAETMIKLLQEGLARKNAEIEYLAFKVNSLREFEAIAKGLTK